MATIRVVVKSHVPKVAAAVHAKAAIVTAKAAHDVQGEAQQRARVDTGAMRAGIQARKIDSLNWLIVGQAAHTVFNEYGTSRMSAQPMFHPAAEIVRPSYIAAMRQLL